MSFQSTDDLQMSFQSTNEGSPHETHSFTEASRTIHCETPVSRKRLAHNSEEASLQSAVKRMCPSLDTSESPPVVLSIIF